MEIEAAVVRETSGRFEIETLELEEEPRAGEVRVRVVGAGICHTDRSVRDQHIPTPLPAVLGHEGSGVIEAVGEGVTKVEPGDHVVLAFAHDGTCENCRAGQVTLCENITDLNFAGRRLSDGSTPIHDDGGEISGTFFGQSSFATHAIATEQNVAPVGDDVPLELLGPLGCSIQTGAGGVFNVLDPQAGASIVVSGTGSVGPSAVMAADARGCTDVVAVDPLEPRREKALELGATRAIDPKSVDDVEETIRDHLGDGAEYVLETSGNRQAIRQAVDSLGHGGTCGVVSVPPAGKEVGLDVSDLLRGRTITGTTGGNANPDLFIPDLIDLFRRGKFPFDELVTDCEYDEIETAIEDQEAGKVVKPVLRVGEA